MIANIERVTTSPAQIKGWCSSEKTVLAPKPHSLSIVTGQLTTQLQANADWLKEIDR